MLEANVHTVSYSTPNTVIFKINLDADVEESKYKLNIITLNNSFSKIEERRSIIDISFEFDHFHVIDDTIVFTNTTIHNFLEKVNLMYVDDSDRFVEIDNSSVCLIKRIESDLPRIQTVIIYLNSLYILYF